MNLIERRFCLQCGTPQIVNATEIGCGSPDILSLECGHAISGEQPLTPLCGLGRIIDEQFVRMTTQEIASIIEHGFATSFREP